MKTGMVLALVNCVEMGALGAAYSMSIKKCNGSHLYIRIFAMLLPPVSLTSFAAIGACGAHEAEEHPAVLGIAIAFAIVTLMQLSVELIHESIQSTNSNNTVFFLFLGVWLTLLLNQVAPPTSS